MYVNVWLTVRYNFIIRRFDEEMNSAKVLLQHTSIERDESEPNLVQELLQDERMASQNDERVRSVLFDIFIAGGDTVIFCIMSL